MLDPVAIDGLRDLVGGDLDALSGLVADFLAETPPLVHALHTAIVEGIAARIVAGSVPAPPCPSAGDPEGAIRAAHTLEGLGATFGAAAMAWLCQRAETHAGLPADLVPVLAEIAAEHERVTLALRRLA